MSTDVGGQTVCDATDDGLHRDVTGDRGVGQGDVAEFFGTQHRSDNDAVPHGHVVEHSDYVVLN